MLSKRRALTERGRAIGGYWSAENLAMFKGLLGVRTNGLDVLSEREGECAFRSAEPSMRFMQRLKQPENILKSLFERERER